MVDITGEPKVIAEVSFPTALTTLHEKAIYLHERNQFHVERFDYEERKAYVKSVDCDYYTDAIDYTQVKTLQEFESGAAERREARARRCARQPADRRLQKDQVLHDGECRRGQALDAGAGDAHHCFLAPLPGGVPGASRRVHPDRKAGRNLGSRECAPHGRRRCC